MFRNYCTIFLQTKYKIPEANLMKLSPFITFLLLGDITILLYWGYTDLKEGFRVTGDYIQPSHYTEIVTIKGEWYSDILVSYMNYTVWRPLTWHRLSMVIHISPHNLQLTLIIISIGLKKIWLSDKRTNKTCPDSSFWFFHQVTYYIFHTRVLDGSKWCH